MSTNKGVVVTTPVISGSGKEAMDELWAQTKGLYVPGQEVDQGLSQTNRFNVIPQIDVFLDDGQTKEEWKMVAETRKF